MSNRLIHRAISRGEFYLLATTAALLLCRRQQQNPQLGASWRNQAGFSSQ